MNTKDNIQLKPEKEISLMPFFVVMFKCRWLIILLTVTGVIAGVVFTRQTYKENYLVTTSILLQPPRKVADSKDYLGSIQAKDLLNSTFSVVLNSNDFLKSVVLADYDVSENGKRIKTNLLKYFKIEDAGQAIEKVKGLIKINYDKKTSMLVLEYTSSYPDIAAQILNNIVTQINYFYNYQFNSNSIRNLEFVEKSIASAKKELDDEKANLTIFIERNKQLKVALKNKDQYPEYYQCIEAMEKLQENVDLKRKTYTGLMIKGESLKLEITENAPYVTVIESATAPLRPIPCNYNRNVVMGGFIGFLFAAACVILNNFVALFNLHNTPAETIPAELKNDCMKMLKAFRSKKRKTD